ncbi:MAG: polysaccharide biosynthesis tyrosine autokinase [Chloroflexi bacterium]|nr:polysaccharide biosynthesis tyrosine autokinase [Chloroflexota bacterium]
MELNRYLSIVVRWLWLLVLAAVIASLAALWATRQQPPVYMAQSKLIVGPGVGSPDPDLNALRTGGQLMQTYAQLATTGPVLQAVISELGLSIPPESLAQSIDLKSDLDTQILTIRVRSGNAMRAATIANSLAEILVRVASASSSAPLAQLLSQIQADSDKFRQIVDESEVKIQQLQTQLQTADPAIESEIRTHKTRIVQLEAELAKPVDSTTNQAILDEQLKIKQLEAAFQVTVDVTARRLILDQLTLEYNRLSNAQNADAARKRLLLDQLAWEHTRVDDLNKDETERRSLIQDQIKSEQTRQSEAQRNLAQLPSAVQKAQTNQLQIIERASTGTPVTTPLALTLLLAGSAGFVLAFIIALVFEYFDKTVRSVEELAEIHGLPILGAIAKQRETSGIAPGSLTVQSLPQSNAAENYRMISTKLLSGNSQTPCRSILISGMESGSKETEIAANLCVTLAEMGKRVVLADANPRHPTVHRILGVAVTPGLVDLLSGDPKRSEPVALDWVPNLSLVPAGLTPSNPFELLASPHVVSILNEFERDYDLVIITAGPLLSFAENLLLASRADGVILVVEAGKTSREAISKAVVSLQSLGAHIVGSILDHNAPTQRQWMLGLIDRLKPRVMNWIKPRQRH